MTLESQIAKLTNETTKLIDVVNQKLTNALYEVNILKNLQSFDFLVSKEFKIKSIKEAQDLVIEERIKTGDEARHYTILVRSFVDTSIVVTVSNITLLFPDNVSFALVVGKPAIVIGNESQKAENVIIRGGAYKYQTYSDDNTPVVVVNGWAQVWNIRTVGANCDPKRAGLEHLGPVFNQEK
ncbi:MAG: hypothetical protein AB8G05_27425 [Oligoflexales bacterium]